MCGICGWIDTKSIDRQVLEKMIRELRHRGPDVQKIEVLDNVGLGHARLSIIDLTSNANQPIHNEDKSLWLVYNGEFYTFQSFRNELLKKGHCFISHTDSEVLLHLYEEDGPEFVRKLRGMFAFGLWDTKQEQLLLARDRVGIKPLYYFYKDNTFLFASELKALLKHPAVSREMSPEAISYYFMLGYIPREHCIFKSVKKLLPGHYLLYKNGLVTTHSYWELPEQNETLNQSDDEYAQELLTRLDESVKMRLISDVPLGVFLSGGIDSSIVAALAAKNSSTPIKTFSIGFEDEKFNELPFARRIAHHIGADHHEFIVRVKEADILEKLMYYYDEPFADSSIIPTYYVSKMAKEYVTVVLSGDGGDELFGGYNWYDWILIQSKFNFVPVLIRNAISYLASTPLIDYKGKRFLMSLGLDELNTFKERCFFFSPEELPKILFSHCETNTTRAFDEFYQNSGFTSLERMTKTDFLYYLPDDILTKIDRASMAVSLETRVPILDHKVCEFAFSQPDSMKIRGKTKKYLLKQVAKELLPANYPLERKHGFSIPLNDWMKGSLGDMCMDLINNNASVFQNRPYIEKLLKEHRLGRCNTSRKLWLVLVFNLWLKNNL